jgi:capsular polysaccharide biosynthesis protein
VKRVKATDDWFENEPRTRVGFVRELRRIAARTRVRPVRVIVLAALFTGLIGARFMLKKPVVEAEVVLLLRQGALAQKSDVAPVTVEQLRDYVATVLLPDEKLRALIDHRNLFRIRAKMGEEFAVTELRQQIEIEVWKNTFVYYDEDIANPEHSARIGITVADTDPDRAIMIARDLADIVITTSDEHQRQVAGVLATDIAALRDGLAKRLDELAADHAQRVTELVTAQRANKPELASALSVAIAEIEHTQAKLEQEQALVLSSRDAVADRIAAAGLDMSVQIVEENHPERVAHGPFVLVMVLTVVGLGALAGSALVFGAFDSRLHDLDDLGRLGLPVLGHIPGFPGDGVGSLDTRGGLTVPRHALSRRVPSFRRWRAQR